MSSSVTLGVSITSTLGSVIGVALILSRPSTRKLHIHWFVLSFLVAILLQSLIVLPLELLAVRSVNHGWAACHMGVFFDRLTAAAIPMMTACITYERLRVVRYRSSQLSNVSQHAHIIILLMFSWVLALGLSSILFGIPLPYGPQTWPYPLDDCHQIWLHIMGREPLEFTLRVAIPLFVNFLLSMIFLITLIKQKVQHGYSATRSLLLILALNASQAIFDWPMPLYFLSLKLHPLAAYGIDTEVALVDVHRVSYAVLPIILLIFVVSNSPDLYKVKDKKGNDDIVIANLNVDWTKLDMKTDE